MSCFGILCHFFSKIFSFTAPHGHLTWNMLTRYSRFYRSNDYLPRLPRPVLLMDMDKLTTIQEWTQLVTVSQLLDFLGLTGYYWKFIRSYASLIAPLIDLTKHDALVWMLTTESTFGDLKGALITAPVLYLLHFSFPFTLKTNGSGTGVSAILI